MANLRKPMHVSMEVNGIKALVKIGLREVKELTILLFLRPMC